ncbi:hypothetical protein LJC53_04865 [Bacteroidales bacterium OttesenSCG-928-C03]|nr:hypothetical protein [Bacteroidales bacterium OttesenSCG-928-C03]MDL2326134.1 hypothetical protein [Bacteroidales bacterium OttesenSCG-928-A14]
MPKIRLIGNLDIELTKIGLKAGDTIGDAFFSPTNKAMYFNVHHVIFNECVVYPKNYEILKE